MNCRTPASRADSSSRSEPSTLSSRSGSSERCSSIPSPASCESPRRRRRPVLRRLRVSCVVPTTPLGDERRDVVAPAGSRTSAGRRARRGEGLGRVTADESGAPVSATSIACHLTPTPKAPAALADSIALAMLWRPKSQGEPVSSQGSEDRMNRRCTSTVSVFVMALFAFAARRAPKTWWQIRSTPRGRSSSRAP